MEYVLIGIICMFAYPYLLLTVDKIKHTHYTCNQFGWHDGNGISHHSDGCSIHSKCSKCGVDVMQDGQGNWF